MTVGSHPARNRVGGALRYAKASRGSNGLTLVRGGAGFSRYRHRLVSLPVAGSPRASIGELPRCEGVTVCPWLRVVFPRASASKRFAVIADVHGNALALEAVLRDAATRSVDYLINLGDNANGPLEPARAVGLLRGGGDAFHHVRGNGDRMVGDPASPATRSALFARDRLREDDLRWLRDLPRVMAHPDGWLAFHGSPTSDVAYVVETVLPTGLASRPRAEVAAILSPAQESLLLCGHTHLPRCVRLDDGRVVVNPGSVGLPAYDDSSPYPHRVEAGSPDARYAVIERGGARWNVELISVPYDFRAAAEQARTAGWDEWAYNLETGRCR